MKNLILMLCLLVFAGCGEDYTMCPGETCPTPTPTTIPGVIPVPTPPIIPGILPTPAPTPVVPLVCDEAGPALVDLGTAGDFAILAKSGIDTVPASDVTGDIGVSPIASTAITGFDLILDGSGTFSTSTQVTGEVYAFSYIAPTPTKMTTAVSDMETAYTDAAGRPDPTATELYDGDLGGRTLCPGLYKWSTGVLIPTDMYLSGGADAVWIMQIAGNLELATSITVHLLDGAQAKNIFWVVAGNVAFGATSQFEGNVLSATDITLETGAAMNGRLLSQTAVNLQSATVVKP